MKNLAFAIGLMVLVALSSQALAGEGEPDPKIEIDTELLKIEFVNLEDEKANIDFIKGKGDGSNIETIDDFTIPVTNGWAYYVIIGESAEELENGEYFDLPTGTYTVVATAGNLTKEATIFVP
jgi:hypothetical protein